MDGLGMVKLEVTPKRINQGPRHVFYAFGTKSQKKTLVLFKSRHKKIIFHNNFLGEINMTDTFTTPFDGFK